MPSWFPRILVAVMILEAVSFFAGALLHAGITAPLGFTTLDEPRIIPAAIVETICGLALLIGGITLAQDQTASWDLVIGAHVVAIAGVILGIVALAIGAGPRTRANDVYHLIILTSMAISLVAILIWRPRRTHVHSKS